VKNLSVQSPPLPWWAAGILLGLVQVLAAGLAVQFDVSNEFVAVDARVLNRLAPAYADNHPLISRAERAKFGYGSWFCVGIFLGGFVAALILRTWNVRAVCAWWRRNHNAPAVLRLIAGFVAGVLMLIGAGLARGGASEHLLGGWAQLSLSAVPFTLAMAGSGMIVAYIAYPGSPGINRRGR